MWYSGGQFLPRGPHGRILARCAHCTLLLPQTVPESLQIAYLLSLPQHQSLISLVVHCCSLPCFGPRKHARPDWSTSVLRECYGLGGAVGGGDHVGEGGMSAPLLTIAGFCPCGIPPFPALTRFTFSQSQAMKTGGYFPPISAIDVGNCNTKHGVPDQQRLHISGVLLLRACGVAMGVCPLCHRWMLMGLLSG